jgi:hypothetical protein
MKSVVPMSGELLVDDGNITPLQSYKEKTRLLRKAMRSVVKEYNGEFTIKDPKLFIETIKELNKMEGHYKLDMLTDNKVLVDAKFLREMAQKNRHVNRQ